VDVVATAVRLAVPLLLDRDAGRRRQALGAGEGHLLVVEARQRPNRALGEWRLAEPDPNAGRAARRQPIQQVALEGEYLAGQVVGEWQALGVPRRHRRARRGAVDVHLRSAAVAELEALAADDEHVAGVEGVEVVLVEFAHPLVAPADEHVTREGVGDGADVGEVDHPREAAALADQALADLELGVVVLAVRWIVPVPPHLRVDVALLQPLVVGGEIPDERLELRVREVAVGVGAAERRRHLGLASHAVDRHPVDVLGGHVVGVLGDEHPVDEPRLDLADHHRRLHEVVAVEGDYVPLDHLPDLVARAADPLEERRDGLGRPHLHHQVDVGHVDAEFEAGRSRDHVEVAALESRLDRLPTVGREAAVVTRRVRVVVVEALAQGLERPLGARAGVGKDQRVGVGVDQVVQLLVEPAPDRLVRRPDEVVDRAVDLQVELAGEPGVDDLAVAWLAALAADEKVRHRLQWLDRRRTADSGRGAVGQVFESLQRHREVRAALVRRERVNLVDDDVLDGPELLAELRGVEQDGERLGRRVEDVWRLREHPLASRVVGVAVAGGVAHLRRFAPVGESLADAVERFGQVAVNVVRERLQRRDVETVHRVLQPLAALPTKQFVDDGGEGGERLAAPRRRTDQRVLAFVDEGDGLALWRREEAAVFGDERAEPVDPPLADGRVEDGEHVGVGNVVCVDAVGKGQVGQRVGPRSVHRLEVGVDDQVGCAGGERESEK